MRVNNVFSGRPAYYDRNPTNQTIDYQADGIAPHGQTTRATYTVPAGRKAYIDMGQTQNIQSLASAPAGVVTARLGYIPNGGAVARLMETTRINATLGDRASQMLGQAGLLLAGDAVNLVTADASTGGTVNYRLSIKLVEFDA